MGKQADARTTAPILSNLTMETAPLNPPLFPLSNGMDEISGKAQETRAFCELKLIIIHDVDLNPES